MASVTGERVFSFAGLTLSDLHKYLLEGTLETIMWIEWGSPSIPWVEVIFTYLTLNFVTKIAFL